MITEILLLWNKIIGPNTLSPQFVSEWLLLNAKWAIFFSYIIVRTIYNQWDVNDVCFVLDQDASLDFYSASSLKQQSAGRHVVPLRHCRIYIRFNFIELVKLLISI